MPGSGDRKTNEKHLEVTSDASLVVSGAAAEICTDAAGYEQAT